MEFVQVATCTGPKRVHVATCKRFLVQVVENLNLYITYLTKYLRKKLALIFQFVL